MHEEPHFKFTEAVSFCINCESQEEIDYFWEKLTVAGGQGSVCGLLKDKFGLSWQVVSTGWDRMLNDPQSRKSETGHGCDNENEEDRPRSC
jgi:predicted 3-demethylubiquinone-9 3-methyltransferase (glyoxalase superfamily)